MSRNVVVHEHMGDPAGYSISYDEDRRFLVVRLHDAALIGRFDSRVEALAAAEADRAAPPGPSPAPPGLDTGAHGAGSPPG